MNFKFNSIVLALALAFASSSLLDGVTAANQQQLRGSADSDTVSPTASPTVTPTDAVAGTANAVSNNNILEAYSNGNESIGCPLPRLDPKDGRWRCPNQKLSLDERRKLLPPPYDEINGEKLYSTWPATEGTTTFISNNTNPSNYIVTDTSGIAVSSQTSSQFEYEGVTYAGYRLGRPEGERAPIHYHETPQLLCLREGKIMVKTEGLPDATYEAPDCYMMPAYTKASVISLTGGKVEDCLFRTPYGGRDWVVIEPNYYNLQGQWLV